MKLLYEYEHAEELIRLGFSPNLYANHDFCEKILDHCNRYDMKFLEHSYGTIVHKDFNKYFKLISFDKARHLMPKNGELADHINALQCKTNKNIKMITTSPYLTFHRGIYSFIEEYPYDVYALNPNFMDYMAFATGNHKIVRLPFMDITYAFTDADAEELEELNKAIYKDINIFPTFIPIKVNGYVIK